MSIYDSKLWISDLDEIIADLPWLSELCGKSVFITGCSGLICSAVTDILIRWNETHGEDGGKIRILAAGRNEQNVRARFAPYDEADWFEFVYYDASAMENTLTQPCDYIIHGASNASPNKITKEPAETMASNFIGLKFLLEHALKVNTKRVLYISSSEVYGKKDDNMPFREGEYGYIDILNPRMSYSVGKRAAETLCASFADEYGVSTVITRPGHIYGPTAAANDNRVSSAWPYDVARGQNIVMKSAGSQIRSYCYCLDCASAILTVLVKGEPQHAYNISNPDSIISIREMAEILAEKAGVELHKELPTEAEKKSFNPMTNSSLDSTALEALGWRGLFDAQRGFGHTIEILKEAII